MSLFHILKQRVENSPEKIAIVIDNKEYSYKKFFKLVRNIIIVFKRKKISKNSVIAIFEDNTILHAASLFAISYLNATAVPLGTSYSFQQVRKFIKTSGAKFAIGNPNLLNFKEIRQRITFIKIDNLNNFNFYSNKQKNLNISKKIDVNKNYIISMTSGSTSNPKPIIFSQKNKIIRYNLFKKLYKITKKDIIIISCPLTTSLGMRMLFLPLLTGCTCIIMKRFYPMLYLEYISKYKVTFSALVSTQIDNLIKEKKHFKKFFLKKGLVSCSSKLFMNTKKIILKKKINLHEMYGASEIGTVTSVNLNKNNSYLYKSVGKSYDRNIVIKILSKKNRFLRANKIGEIVCKTPGIFNGYLNEKNFTKNAFFKNYFKTGDVGYLNKRGYLFFLGRKKNIIKKSGINIFLEDIENLLLENKQINEVSAVPIYNQKKNKIILFVKKEKGINYEIVRNFCLKNLSNQQLPDKIMMIKKFPKTNSQKIDRQRLKVIYNKSKS